MEYVLSLIPKILKCIEKIPNKNIEKNIYTILTCGFFYQIRQINQTVSSSQRLSPLFVRFHFVANLCFGAPHHTNPGYIDSKELIDIFKQH